MCSIVPRISSNLLNTLLPCAANHAGPLHRHRSPALSLSSPERVQDPLLPANTFPLSALHSFRPRMLHSLASANRACGSSNKRLNSVVSHLACNPHPVGSTPTQSFCLILDRGLSGGSNSLAFLNSSNIAANSRLPVPIIWSTAIRRQSGESDEEYRERKRKHAEGLKKNTWRGFYFFTIGLGLSIVLFIVTNGAPVKDEDGLEVPDEFSDLPFFTRYLKRSWAEITFFKKMIAEPSRPKLLPDPLRDPYYQPPYTLVIEMNGILVHPDWTYGTGWRFKKRNAVDFFIQQVGYPIFEVVIYTSEQGFTAFPIIDNLDPNGLIMYRLFRDATKYSNGHHIKDLDKLNRDLTKVILVEWDPNAFQLNPENALRIPRWQGQEDDAALVELAGLLKTIAASGAKDVRPILEYYSRFDDPLKAFKENQQKLQEAQNLSQPQDGSSLTKSWTGRLFGFRRHN